jgi:5-methylcytosine-specific restriction protein B
MFREWLRARGGNSNSVNTRSAAVRKIEKELASLGSAHTDLDAAFDKDKFAGLKHELNAMRDDARSGGTRYRSLFPNSNDPLNRIANSKAWLGQYGQFRSGSEQNGAAEMSSTESFWFVGASFGRTDDQAQRFIRDGI